VYIYSFKIFWEYYSELTVFRVSSEKFIRGPHRPRVANLWCRRYSVFLDTDLFEYVTRSAAYSKHVYVTMKLCARSEINMKQ
jgi:hypothetical protein